VRQVTDNPLPSKDASAIATTSDAFLGGRLWLSQPARGYRAGLDAIIVAAACSASPDANSTVLDCGSGVGAVGLAIATRCPVASLVLVEKSPDLARIALENAASNRLEHRVTIVNADVTANLATCPALLARAESFDHVIANPPYFDHAHGTRASDTLKDGSHAMPSGTLDDWVRFAASMAKPGGTYTLIHRAEALGDILVACQRRFGGLKILPLHTRAEASATRVIIQGIKGSRAPLALLQGRAVHGPDGKAYTAEFESVLRSGAGIVL
jgi:tRNA1(Val) A37 N6-methylase TrmN6